MFRCPILLHNDPIRREYLDRIPFRACSDRAHSSLERRTPNQGKWLTAFCGSPLLISGNFLGMAVLQGFEVLSFPQLWSCEHALAGHVPSMGRRVLRSKSNIA
jgi:hypothetical protein